MAAVKDAQYICANRRKVDGCQGASRGKFRVCTFCGYHILPEWLHGCKAAKARDDVSLWCSVI